MRHLLWASVAALAFLAGVYFGSGGGPRPAGAVWAVQTPQAAAPEAALQRPRVTTGVAATVARERPGAGSWQAEASWRADLDRLDELARDGKTPAAAQLQRRLLGELLERARSGDPGAAARRLEAYLARNPHDADAYLLDSDLRQMQGHTLEAFAPLLDLLQFEDDPAVVARARDRLRLLVDAREAQLASTGDVAGLIRMFDDLSQRDPGFDGHRLRLARWLLQAGRLDEAEQTLAETGTVGVDPEAREDLVARLRLARTSLPLERRDGAWHVATLMDGRSFDMLVDTGATTTAITRARAAALGAAPTGARVRVHTANGVVESEVLRVPEVEIGGVHLDSLNVLVLDGPLPQGVDGLLGMDVLSRFPGVPAADAAVRPR